ncbi:MAG: aminopeptidase, partial [Prevotellaceae bacterium]|nr:aminopeptidase [Prevotellaceae bacterium]
MRKSILVSFVLVSFCAAVFAQNVEEKDSFQFTVVKENKITSVKDQASSGTCWSFSALGFLESELLRAGKPEVDLSEMFVVYQSYLDKAEKYIRMHGTVNFAGGGSFYDVLYSWKTYGVVPNDQMTGLNYGSERHNHSELDAVLKAYVDAVLKNGESKNISTVWKTGFKAVLDTYLGVPPTDFTVGGKKYTPKTYAESLGLNMDDYVSLTSFTHHPFYSKFVLEIPDNWRWSESYNLPVEDLMRVFDNAINNDYTIAWGADVSERGFTRNGIGVLPETNLTNLPGSDQARWTGLSQRDIEAQIYKVEKPQPEVKVTQELRQQEFDNYKTTDDHGMQIFGIAKDQNGTKYYIVKNSWATTSKYKGIWYISEAFVKLKT